MKNVFCIFLYFIFFGILVDGFYLFGNEYGDYWLLNIFDSIFLLVEFLMNFLFFNNKICNCFVSIIFKYYF